jgi:hypothetical protein
VVCGLGVFLRVSGLIWCGGLCFLCVSLLYVGVWGVVLFLVIDVVFDLVVGV